MRIPVYKNNILVKFSIVDDDRTDLLQHNYYLDTSGYVRRNVCIAKNKTVDRYLHHDVLKTGIGSENLFYVCDHINGDPLDNRLKNLRMCSASQNNYNKRSVTGVSFHKQSGKYEATLTRNRKKNYFLVCINQSVLLEMLINLQNQ